MKFYRYYDSVTTIGVIVYCTVLYLIKETPKGYWIGYMDYNDKPTCWVSKTAKKRYAYPTKQEAWDSFKARKARQVNILTKKLDIAKQALYTKQADVKY